MEKQRSIIILDVRTPKEFAKAHIPGAINIPNDTIDASVADVLQDKQQHIMVYCKSGLRSKEAAQKLTALGYTKIEEIGSIDDWVGELESSPNP